MKKLSALIFLVVFLAFLRPQQALGDYSSTYKSYQDLNDYYRKAYQNYITSKNKYLTYKTLTAQKEALDYGKEFLKTRDQMVLTYLEILRSKVNETGGYSETDKSLIFGNLNVESVWLSNIRSKYDVASTLNDLQNVSNQVQDRYLNTVRPISLGVAGSIYLNKYDLIYNTLEEILNTLESNLQNIRASGDNTEVAERWLLEAKNKASLAKDKENEAQFLFSNLHGQSLVNDFNQGVFYLTQGNQYMREANSYIAEVINNIKGQ